MSFLRFRALECHSLGSIVSHHNTYSLGRCSKIVPHLNSHNFLFTSMIEVFYNILELKRLKLPLAFNFAIVTLSLYEWKMFSTLRALIHNRLTWINDVTSPMS